MKVLWTLNMQVLVLWNSFLSFFISFFSFLLNNQPLKVSTKYICQALKLKRKIHFEDCATQANDSEEQIWFT
jgi:hypothetical protein